MALPGPICAQQAGAAAAAPAQPGDLKIVVLEGEGAKNFTKSRSGVNAVVEVRDQADKAVPNAEVVFQLPAAGPGGVFNGWMRTQTTRTDEKGQAGTNGFTPNDQEGRFNIKVTATAGTKSAGAVIAQANVKGAGGDPTMSNGKSNWWKWALGVGATGAVIGIVAGTRDNGTKTAAAATPIPVTISPGAVSVGGPR
jgi:hypothetical protein